MPHTSLVYSEVSAVWIVMEVSRISTANPSLYITLRGKGNREGSTINRYMTVSAAGFINRSDAIGVIVHFATSLRLSRTFINVEDIRGEYFVSRTERSSRTSVTSLANHSEIFLFFFAL
jgi:hypothetical protein